MPAHAGVCILQLLYSLDLFRGRLPDTLGWRGEIGRMVQVQKLDIALLSLPRPCSGFLDIRVDISG